MNISTLKREMKFWEPCGQAHIPLWECPSILFVFMGMLTIVGMLVTYQLATAYGDPQIVIASVSVIGVLIFTVGVAIVSGFDRVVQASLMRMEFVSIASHQLRAPLSSMKWVFELLLDQHIGELNEKQKKYLHAISADNERMIALINNLLDASRIEGGQLIPTKGRVELSTIIPQVAKDVGMRFQKFPQAITIEPFPAGTAVLADERYIRIILENLLDNALRYGIGKKDVVVRVLSKKDSVRVEVEDFGQGIQRGEQRFVFQKFFRSLSTESRADGKGLGLFTARYLAEGMGGRVGFHSEEQKGSLFWVELPSAR